MSTITQYQQLGKYLFVSMDQNNEIGSVYYEKGRIRLVHGHGPEISGHECIAYFVVPKGFTKLKDYDNYKDKDFDTIYNFIDNNHGLLLEQTNNILMQGHNYKSYSINTINGISSMILYEVYFKNKNNIFKSYNRHHSRGYPQYLNISNDTALKEIFDAISNNKELSNAQRNSFYPNSQGIIKSANEQIYNLYNFHNPFNCKIHDPQNV